MVAGRVAAGGPADRAGVRVGDILLGIDGDEVLTRGAGPGSPRGPESGGSRRRTPCSVPTSGAPSRSWSQPLPKGNVTLFYFLSVFGFFSLVVGTIVMLRRPPDRAALHFYAICLLFFLMYSTSFTGKLDLADWTLLWTDHLAILLLPVVFLHFCLSFPERKITTFRGWVIPAAYMPALALAGASVASQILFVATTRRERSCGASTAAIDQSRPLYFAVLFAVSFAILLHSYRRTHGVTARKQMKWLVWGTGAGILPFFVFYAIPFALGREPRFAMELAGYVPLALIPLSLAYAVVKHRLMDVELIFRRTLVYLLATVGDRRDLPARRRPLRQRALGRRRAPRQPHRDPVGARGDPALHPGEDADPGGDRASLLQGALRLAPRAPPPVPGPERRSRPRPDRRAAPGADERRAGRLVDGGLPASTRWLLRDLPIGGLPRRAPSPCASRQAGALLERLALGEPGERRDLGRVVPRGRAPRPRVLLPLPRQGRGDRRPRRGPQGRASIP